MTSQYLNELYSKNVDVAYAEAKKKYTLLRKVLILKYLVLIMQVIGIIIFVFYSILLSTKTNIMDKFICFFLLSTLFYNIVFIKIEAIIGGWYCKAKLSIKDYEEIIPYEKFRKHFLLDKKLMDKQITQDHWKREKQALNNERKIIL